jgi:biotin carboxyl carrier protein
MSKRTHALVLAAMVAAMNLAGMTAIAQAQPPDGVEQFRRGERASQEQSTTAEAVEEFRRGERASQQRPTSADTRRPPTEAQVGESWRHPGNVGVRSPEPGGQPDWLIPGIGALAAILALVAGLVVMATKRAGRRVRAGQAA